MLTSIIFYSVSFILLIVSFSKDKIKTKSALKKAYKSFMNLMPSLLAMLLFIGFILTFISPESVSKILGKDSGLPGTIFGLIIGSFAMLPGFVAFPLGANLLKAGAGYTQVAGFLGTLMAVGITTIFIEIKFFNKKLTIMRNILALLGSIMFSIMIWAVM
ncbi:MAG: hypothetical protein JXM74_09990 [Fusobacteriaceae bacterium]|nr:hypothetical protein [Fusobacteriaceae bacterium]